MMGNRQDFREGDRAWPGAAIVELPDLSSVHLTARLDEADRGRVEVGQAATVHLDAVPDRLYDSKVSKISMLARVDFSTSWPPTRDFDLELDMARSRRAHQARHDRHGPRRRRQAPERAGGAVAGGVARQRPADRLRAGLVAGSRRGRS